MVNIVNLNNTSNLNNSKISHKIFVLAIINSFFSVIIGISLLVFFITSILGVIVLTLKFLLYTLNLMIMIFSLFTTSIIYIHRTLKIAKLFCIISFFLLSFGIIASFFDYLTLFEIVIVYFSFIWVYIDTFFSIIVHFFIFICLLIFIFNSAKKMYKI
ncbi:MAG: hypothetical protein LBF02_00040 [Mycoplasmataceae bacterium]|nr:hypothetical protein [Mycoplasmataceae bacterium]